MAFIGDLRNPKKKKERTAGKPLAWRLPVGPARPDSAIPELHT